MDHLLQPGTVVAGRFQLTSLVGQGALGSVWLGVDRTGRRVVIKLFAKSSNNYIAREYYAHLIELNRKLSEQPSPYVVLPLDWGEIDEYWYQILPYYENVVSLDRLMRERVPMHLGKAIPLVASIARALSDVHRASLVHADLKPSNILVSEVPTSNVYLIDFGMAQPSEAEQTVLLVATYRYLHPSLSQGTSAAGSSGRVSVKFTSEIIGPYIDIYAMGVLALELVTGKAEAVHPVTEQHISALITEVSPSVAETNGLILHRISNLIFQMLAVGPSRENISAQSVAVLAESIAQAIPKELNPLPIPPSPTASAYQTGSRGGTATLVREVRRIGYKLEQATVTLVAGAGDVEVASPESDDEMLRELGTVFSNSLVRTQASWRLAIAMTIASFAVIVAMVAIAVTLTVATGKQSWGLVFGGLSVASLIGTLIWRPYDRLFRATILAQQIEVIHVSIVVGLRGTVKLRERLRICREAVTRLQTVFREHAQENRQGRATAKSGRRRKGT